MQRGWTESTSVFMHNSEIPWPCDSANRIQDPQSGAIEICRTQLIWIESSVQDQCGSGTFSDTGRHGSTRTVRRFTSGLERCNWKIPQNWEEQCNYKTTSSQLRLPAVFMAVFMADSEIQPPYPFKQCGSQPIDTNCKTDVGAITVTLKKLTGRSSMHWGYLLITRVNIGVWRLSHYNH
jgi:hypothetical protein